MDYTGLDKKQTSCGLYARHRGDEEYLKLIFRPECVFKLLKDFFVSNI